MTKTLSFQSVQRSVRLEGFLLVASSALALALTVRMAGSALVLTTALVIAWFWKPGFRRSNLWEILSFTYLLFFFFDLLRISQALAPALVHLFIFILINKMFNLTSVRDYYQLYLLTFLTVLAASSLSVEIEMFYMIVGYIILLIWNISSLTLFREWQQDDSQEFPFSLFHPMYFAAIVIAGIITFIVALSIFFVLPRMQLGYLTELGATSTQHVSGFSQKVTLGDIASIQENSDVAMRVRVTPDNNAVGPYYWRGISFDHYDGTTWSTGYPGNRFLFRDSSGIYHSTGSNIDSRNLVLQEFYMEPLDTRVIFGLDKMVRIKGDFGEVSRDTNGTLMAMGRVTHYEAYSRLNRPSRDQLKTAGELPISEQLRRYHLQLPNRSTRIEQLARSITQDKFSLLDKVLAVEFHLQKNYQYSLSEITQDSKDPIKRFLFETKSGHCEYFATGMVILLRHLDIPARIVNGFLEGEYNDIGGFYVVRNSDAHSWVEVNFDGIWVAFDPSPRPELIVDSQRFQIDFQKILESIRFFWDRYILIFSGQDQVDAISVFRDSYRQLKNRFSNRTDQGGAILEKVDDWWKRNRKSIAILFGLIVVIAFGIRFILRRQKTLRISRSPILFYQEMLSILEKKGIRREPNSTPAEFMKVIQEQVTPQIQTEMNHLTELFYRTRFGHYQLTNLDQLHIRESLQRLRQ